MADKSKELSPSFGSKEGTVIKPKPKVKRQGTVVVDPIPVVKNTERTPAQGDKSFDKMRPGGSNSQYEKDGTKKKPKYNPYGTGTANPSNMSGSTGP